MGKARLFVVKSKDIQLGGGVMSYTAIISFLLILAFLGVSTVAYGGISLFIIVPIIIATGFLVKEVS